MSKDVMTDEDARNLEAWARACLGEGDGWLWGDFAPEGGFATIEEAAADASTYVQNALRGVSGEVPAHALHMWGVHATVDGETLVVAMTGNGPTSRDHARFLASAPRAVLSLLRERAELLARLRTIAEAAR